APGAQRAGTGVGVVAELEDRRLDAPARGLGDGAGAGEHVAHGRLGDPGEAGDVLARRRLLPPRPVLRHLPPSPARRHPVVSPEAPVFHASRALLRPSARSSARAPARASSSRSASCTLAPVPAERTAASTIAWVHTFACTSDSGAGPPRSAGQKVVREASSSQRSSAPGVRPARSGPSAGCAVGGLSPSQSTLPCSQLSRQSPFQLVSAPGEHQEPEKV